MNADASAAVGNGPPGSRVPAPHRAAETLREEIAAGRIPPGTKLPEVRLTEMLKVSRHTLRSAFQLLAAEGLVVAHPNRGVFVHSPTAEDIREIYRVRRIIEPGLVRAISFDPQRLAELGQIVDRAALSREASNVLAMAEANQEFHRCLISQAESLMLEDLMTKILAQMRLIFAGMHEHPDFHSEFVSGNARLVELLSAGRPEAAAEYFRAYLDAAEEQLLSAYQYPTTI